MDETIETPTKKDFTRREFFKFGAVLVGGFALEQIISPVKKTAEFLEYMGILQEGNPLQRAGTFQELNRRVLLSPTEENRKLLTSWLKLNIAEMYARKEGWNLAAVTMQHYLYGGGTPLDITSHFISSVEENFQPANPNQGDRDRKLVDFLTKSISTYESRIITPDQEHIGDIASREKGQVPVHIVTQLIPITEDIHYSLNRYSDEINNDAEISIISNPEQDTYHPQAYKIMFPKSTHNVFDTYHWQAGRSFNSASVGVGPLLFSLGLSYEKLEKLIGKQRALELLTKEVIGIGATDGVILEKHGFGKSFEERAQFSINTPITLVFPKRE